MSNGTAAWWSKPGVGHDDVVAHTPDATKYHYTDDRQNSRMRSGIMGVVIPRANNDGTSKGFDAGHANVVHVDPDAPDGGAVVDLTTLTPGRYYDAFSKSSFPHEVFYRLSREKPVAAQASLQKTAAAPRINELVPGGTYVVPSAQADGSQSSFSPQDFPMPQIQPVPPLPPLTQPAYAPPPAPTGELTAVPPPQPQYAPPQPAYPSQPQYAPQQPQYAPAPPQYAPAPVSYQPSPEIAQMQQTMGQLITVVNGLAAHIQRPVPPLPVDPPAPPPSRLRTLPEGQTQAAPTARPTFSDDAPVRIPRRRPQVLEEQEEQEQPQTLGHMQAAEQLEDRRESLVVGFETLGMPFVTGPLPTKPKKKVWITLPGAGTTEARYHAVGESPSCLALVYDTRYEDGYQYVPPDLGDKLIEVRVPGNKKRNQPDKIYKCSSMGFHFSVGVLDVIVLVRHPNEDGGQVEETDEE